MLTREVQRNIRVQIMVQAGNLWNINEHTGPNKRTGWIFQHLVVWFVKKFQ